MRRGGRTATSRSRTPSGSGSARRTAARPRSCIHPWTSRTSNRRPRSSPATFLWAHGPVAYKQPEVVVEAFRDLPYRLTMVGVGPLADRLRASLPLNVELRGWVSRAELARLYERSSGEALAAGAPVVALARGGARTSSVPARTGFSSSDRP